MSNIDACGCGYVLEGEGDEDLLADANWHVRISHPELLGTLSPLELARPLDLDDEAA